MVLNDCKKISSESYAQFLRKLKRSKKGFFDHFRANFGYVSQIQSFDYDVIVHTGAPFGVLNFMKIVRTNFSLSSVKFEFLTVESLIH